MKNKIIIGAILVVAIIIIFNVFNKDTNIESPIEENTDTVQEENYSYKEPDENGDIEPPDSELLTEEGYDPKFPE